ncbi:hypothetical protein BDA99DRAFT_333996 [Phascolomyces articulosus]|uniref:Uncharacterized protein n=1 Tax=Phascolomyces articulosus TaxID=60185 RepID=A0AAD5JK80_9FUNG|nr:hypothetical protein BDA99DRAFT_333996 [Phascolomyces articulosus]
MLMPILLLFQGVIFFEVLVKEKHRFLPPPLAIPMFADENLVSHLFYQYIWVFTLLEKKGKNKIKTLPSCSSSCSSSIILSPFTFNLLPFILWSFSEGTLSPVTVASSIHPPSSVEKVHSIINFSVDKLIMINKNMTIHHLSYKKTKFINIYPMYYCCCYYFYCCQLEILFLYQLYKFPHIIQSFY